MSGNKVAAHEPQALPSHRLQVATIVVCDKISASLDGVQVDD